MKYHLKEFMLRIIEIFGNIFPSYLWGNKIRGLLYKPFLKKCGRNFQVDVNVKLTNLNNIEIGNDVYIGYGSWLHGVGGGIVLEDEVMLGPYVTMTSNNHSSRNGSYRFGPGKPGRIHIGSGTWLAAKVTVVANIRIGSNVLVAAQSTVLCDFQDNLLAAGTPAKAVRNNDG